MELLIIVLIVAFVYLRFKKREADNSEVTYETYQSTRPVQVKELSSNIYEAIEQFARICHECKMATGWDYEARDMACIEVYHSMSNTTLKLSCRGECICNALPKEYKWLSNEIDDNEIEYIAENVKEYQPEKYGSTIPSEADSLFYFYKKGDPNAVGQSVGVRDEDGTNHVVMVIRFRK